MNEFARCSFARSMACENQWISTEPWPHGSYVIVWESRAPSGHELWPKFGDHYIVRIDKLSKSGRSRLGTIVLSFKVLEEQLTEALKQATWTRDECGTLEIVEGHLEVPCGRFIPVYDSGIRANGFETSPSVWFRPTQDTPLAELLSHYLACRDETEIERAKRTPFAETATLI